MSDTKPDHYNINAKICRLVEQYPCMYDRSHAHYLKKDVVDQAWIKISNEMNDSISSCKERWRNIRTSYARSINVNKVPASANRTKPYYLHEELQFLALHITPGIPVSRRSGSNSYNGSKADALKVNNMCDESIDSYAGTIDNKTQYNREERSSSVSSDATSKNTQEMEQDIQQLETVTQPQPTQQQQPLPIQNQTLQPQPLPQSTPTVLMETKESESLETEFHPPVVEIQEEDNFEMPLLNARRDSINYACAPPKKRLRVKDNCYASDNFTETKTLDLIPQPDYDGIFLQGLLPEMKAMDFRQKIIFKRRTYEVLGEIFDNSTQASSTTNSSTISHIPQISNEPSPSTATSLHGSVNSTDLNMLRRLNNILQEPPTTPASSASISSTVPFSSPSTPTSVTATVAKVGATTRSSANMTRVRSANVVIPSQNVKQEPETN